MCDTGSGEVRGCLDRDPAEDARPEVFTMPRRSIVPGIYEENACPSIHPHAWDVIGEARGKRGGRLELVRCVRCGVEGIRGRVPAACFAQCLIPEVAEWMQQTSRDARPRRFKPGAGIWGWRFVRPGDGIRSRPRRYWPEDAGDRPQIPIPLRLHRVPAAPDPIPDSKRLRRRDRPQDPAAGGPSCVA